ncbi:MAG: TIGR01777 family oxidoreductase [Deltaproteobacteria bacterium]|nr:TIGR01777 family oxidoreductase [Deltaproteobacteria bacterium]
MRILVTGASGLIGKNLIRNSLSLGHQVYALVRSPDKFFMLPKKNVIAWNHNEIPDLSDLDPLDAIVHLAGESIADSYWTKDRKKSIAESRIIGTRNLVLAVKRLPPDKRPKAFISGSAIGYYGYQRKEILDESATSGTDFLAKVCIEWEAEALAAENLKMRVVVPRTGIVISREGGALAKMPPIQISDGQHWMSWIHIKDMVQILQLMIEDETISGPVNCVTPNPLRNRDFVGLLAEFHKVPLIGSVPRFVLSLVLGEAASVIVSSLSVQPKFLNDKGFQFQFPDLKSALQEELKDWNRLDNSLFKDQFVPLKPDQIFPFFSKAENLETLTPPWLNFKIKAKSNEFLKKESVIDYKLKIHGVSVYWRTLISDWKNNEFFVDEQIKGPYSKWHHLHLFEPVPGGCLLRDEVTYQIPGSLVGKLLLGRWIEKTVNKIFSFRQKRIEEITKLGQLQ